MKNRNIRLSMILGIAVVFAGISAGQSRAQDNPIQDALKGCQTELNEYCSKVTPGDGRLVSCIDAHEDKLSNECVASLNRAQFKLQELGITLTYVAAQCLNDAAKLCPDIPIGQGRVLQCLAGKKSDLSRYCDLALMDVGAFE